MCRQARPKTGGIQVVRQPARLRTRAGDAGGEEKAMSVEPLERATASTEKILANLSPDQLALATPCASWKVRDVINHIAGNGYWFEGIASTGTAPDRPRRFPRT